MGGDYITSSRVKYFPSDQPQIIDYDHNSRCEIVHGSAIGFEIQGYMVQGYML